MATELKLRRGTTSQHQTFTGASSEVTVDSDKNTVVVHDGQTQGGFPLGLESNTTETFDSVGTFLSSSNAYDSGEIVLTREEGFAYKAVDTGGDVINASGQEFEVLPGAEGYNVQAFGAAGDGATDDTSAIQAADAAASAVEGVIFFPQGDYKFSSTLEPSFGVSWVGINSRQKANFPSASGVRLQPTSAVSRAFSVAEKDSVQIRNIFLNMENMSNRQAYTASTISLDAATNTINDSANGLGIFERGEVIQITSGATIDEPRIIKDVSAGTITVHELETSASAGSPVEIVAGPCGFWGNGYRRCVFDNFNISMGSSGKGWVGFNGHDGARSTYYNQHLNCSIKPEVAVDDGVLWALSSTDESVVTAYTSNYFRACIAQGGDYGWFFGRSSAGVVLMNCHGEGGASLGMWVASTASAFSTAVKCYGGEWSDVDTAKDGALHMTGSVVNGTIGALVYESLPGRLLGPKLQLNSLRVENSTISTGDGSSNNINIVPDGIGTIGLNTTSNIARKVAAHGGFEAYRATTTAGKGIIEVFSDVGAAETKTAEIEADGSFLSATNSYGALSDERLKQDIQPAPDFSEALSKLEYKQFRMKSEVDAMGDDAPWHYGVIAQDLQKVGLGHLVKETEEGHLHVNYMGLVLLATLTAKG